MKPHLWARSAIFFTAHLNGSKRPFLSLPNPKGGTSGFPLLWWGQEIKQKEGLTSQSVSGISVITMKILTFPYWAGREGGEWNYARKEHRAFSEAIQGPGQVGHDM